MFAIFCKIGICSIGDGYVMRPMLKEEMVKKRKWLTEEDLLDYSAIGQATPGISAINIATVVGFRQPEFPGALTATLGMITPSLIIITTTTIAAFFGRFQEIELLPRAF